MGFISRVGKWLDSRWPEKISAEEVIKSLTAYEGLSVSFGMLQIEIKKINERLMAFETGARAFDKDLRELRDKNNKIEATLAVMNRVRSSPVLNTSEAWKR